VDDICEYGNEPSGSMEYWFLLTGRATVSFSRMTLDNGVNLVQSSCS
jgi:hypothetical protein